jgi:putative ABC transport system permease protein
VLLLRWTWRDLRARWLQVAAIALIIAIGSGTYSGLTSVSSWRYTSYDASYAALHMYDLRVDLAEGAVVPANQLVDAVTRAVGDDLEAVEARLEARTQVDASSASEQILVPGTLVGVDVDDGGPHVGSIHILDGRGLDERDARAGDVALLDEHFADRHDLPAEGRLTVRGGRTLRYVGRAITPERFFVLDERGGLFADHAVVYAPIETVQDLAGQPRAANQVAMTLAPGAEIGAVEDRVTEALADAFPDVGVTTTRQEDDRVLRILYDDIEGDQRFYNVFAVLILAGAAFAAFNLTVRIVEAQRREIGIGLALGVPARRLAVRPLLAGLQIATLGVIFGVGVGLAMDSVMADVLEGFFPLPAWSFDFQPDVFLRGAVLGLVLPLAATVVPVARAVRVAPVEAIRTGHRASSGGLAPLVRRLPLPGSTVAQMPVRNVLRGPRRAVLTALGIGAAIATLVGVVGTIDSFLGTVEAGEDEIVGTAPDRVVVGMEFAPVDSEPVSAVTGSDLVRNAEAGLTLGGILAPGPDEFEVLISTVDLRSDLWHPTAVEGSLRVDEPGLVLAHKAADDLDIEVGDTVTLRHPRREGPTGYRFVETDLPVLAIHPNPYRFLAYVDARWDGLFDLEGIVSTVQVQPAEGVSVEEVQRGLFSLPGVVSVEPVTASADAIRQQLDEVIGVFDVIRGAILLLTLLIAFNATAINADERARENATMFAFGLPVPRVLVIAIVESVVIGLAGTVLGVVGGRLVLEWLTTVLLPETFPDLGVEVFLTGSTIATAVAFGVLAVALAPVLTLRRLRRMDIPATLRVVE